MKRTPATLAREAAGLGGTKGLAKAARRVGRWRAPVQSWQGWTQSECGGTIGEIRLEEARE